MKAALAADKHWLKLSNFLKDKYMQKRNDSLQTTEEALTRITDVVYEFHLNPYPTSLQRSPLRSHARTHAGS